MKFDTIHRPLGPSPASQRIRGILRALAEGRLLLDPPYQRGRVWTPEQQSAFVGYFLEGGPSPTVYIRQHPLEEVEEVVDGVQRLTALRNFTKNELPAKLSEECSLKTGRETVSWSDFDVASQRLFKSLTLPVVTLRDVTDEEVVNLYLRINSGGTIHTAEDLEKARQARGIRWSK